MWICLNRAFLSIVDKDCPADSLLVRARRAGDIESVFPKAKVARTVGNDYLFRAVVKRAEVVAAIAGEIEDIDYGNFKDSVEDKQLKGAYSSVWGVMSRLQPVPPYSTRRAGTRDLFAR